MGRSPCCPKEGLNRGAWTAHEDKVLTDYIRLHGEGRWRNLPKRAGLKRCGKSCRLRWLNYLRPDIKRGNISSDEEELIIRLHKLLGNKWSLIAGRLPGRTDNEIKNYWNTNLGKKVKDHHHTKNQTISSSTGRCDPPQIGNITPKPQTITPQVTLRTPPTPPNSNDDDDNNNNSLVVRTKATKCSKVLLINPPSPPPLLPLSPIKKQNHSDVVTNEKFVVSPDAVTANVVDDPLSDFQKESGSDDVLENGILSLLVDDDKELSTEDLLMMNYDVVGDVCLSDLLNSDFCCGFSYSNNDTNNDNDELLSPCSDQQQQQQLVLSDEIFKDWTQNNFAE